jgi:hypothetical protein
MKIIEKIREKKTRITKKTTQAKQEARDNRDLAVAAIQAGIRSKAWKAYMEQFADNQEQLMRLMATDGTLGDEEMDIKRAYIVGNAICGSGTPTELDRQVETIDDGL